MLITNKKELTCLALFIKWQNEAPKDKHKIQSFLEDKRNSQSTRLSFILNLIALSNKEDDFNTIFQQFAKYTLRTKDKNSYISKDLWMKDHYHIRGAWYFDACSNVNQKQNWVQYITKIRFSNSFKFSTQFSDCAADFIANKNLKKYEPTTGEYLKLYQEKIEKIDSLTFESVISMLH